MVICFLGGCINRQRNLASSEHYYSILRQKIEKQSGLMPGIRLKNYQSYIQLSSIVKDVLLQPADILVLFIRPFPIHPLIKPVIRFRDSRRRRHLAIHPFLTKKNWPSGTGDEFIERPASKPANTLSGPLHRSIAKINLFAGKAIGLQSWAINEIAEQVAESAAYCQISKTKLIIAGPPVYTANTHILKLCLKLNAHLASLCSHHEISHIDLMTSEDDHANSLLQSDGIHFSTTGHAYLADSLFKIIGPWQQSS
jgi:hypothetical protein